MKHTKGLPIVTFLKLATREELMDSLLNIYNEHRDMKAALKVIKADINVLGYVHKQTIFLIDSLLKEIES